MTTAQLITIMSVGSLLATAAACRENDQPILLGSATLPLALGAEGPSKAATTEAEQALRRTYGAAEMNRHECTTLEADGTIAGDNCPAAFVIFGPYVTVPVNSNLHIRFDIESANSLFVSGDVVSNHTRQFHGSFGDRPISAAQKQYIDYKINFALTTEAVEARVFIRADAPSTFKITNLVVGVDQDPRSLQ
jgi:hypothetical protein